MSDTRTPVTQDELIRMRRLRDKGYSYSHIGGIVGRTRGTVYSALNPRTQPKALPAPTNMIQSVVANMLSEYKGDLETATQFFTELFSTNQEEAKLASILALKLMHQYTSTWANYLTVENILAFSAPRYHNWLMVRDQVHTEEFDPASELLQGYALTLANQTGLHWDYRTQIQYDIGENDFYQEEAHQAIRDEIGKDDWNDIRWDVIAREARTGETVHFINSGLVDILKLTDHEEMHRAHTRLIKQAIEKFDYEPR